MPWVTPEDVAVALGVPPSTPTDEAWLTECVDAANVWCFERRLAAGYVDDADVVPSSRVKQGTVQFAVAQYRLRGTVDSFPSYEQFALPTVAPGGSMGDVNRLLGIPRPAVA